MPPAQTRCLTTIRINSIRINPICISSSSPPSNRFVNHLLLQHHRPFSTTPLRHRKPPLITRFAKPKPQPAAKPQPPTPTASPAPKINEPPAKTEPPQDDEPKTHHHRPPHNNNNNKKRRRPIWGDIAFVLLALPLLPLLSPATPLNQDTFVPFTITTREQVSPTAFLLTVAPRPTWLERTLGFGFGFDWAWGSESGGGEAKTTAEVVRRAWEHGVWAVEVKQPELQVARDYTPLPPPVLSWGREGGEGDGDDGDDGGKGRGEMRFYIRRMEGGEVSGYLARLKVGDTVELRGPRLGWDLRTRLGVEGVEGVEGDGEVKDKEKKKVVFLAGGTGIAPALQAARVVLEKPGVDMQVVWANRRREDCAGCGGGPKEKGGVVEMLEDLRQRYGDRFNYSCTVDQEGSFIDAGTITRSAGLETPAPAPKWPTFSLWARGASQDSSASQEAASAPPLPTVPVNSDGCTYHGSEKLVISDDSDARVGADTEQCQCKDADGNRVTGGKNLLMVSGPDGFIAHFTGAKVWAGGKELQGPVKGVIGDLKRRYPSLAQDWLVLKM